MFEAPDQTLRDRDRAVLVDGAETLSHLPLRQHLLEGATGEHRFLVCDEVAGWPVTGEGLL